MEDTAPQVLNVSPQTSPTPNPNQALLNTDFRGTTEFRNGGLFSTSSPTGEAVFGRAVNTLTYNPELKPVVPSSAVLSGRTDVPRGRGGFQNPPPVVAPVPRAAGPQFAEPFVPEG